MKAKLIILLIAFTAIFAQRGLFTEEPSDVPTVEDIEKAVVEPDPEYKPTEDNDTNLFAEFQRFLGEFNKTYNGAEELEDRFQIFKKNYKHLMDVQKNEDAKEDEDTGLGLTELMDVDPEDFKRSHMTLLVDEEKIAEMNKEGIYANEESSNKGRNLQSLPTNFDWRSYGIIGPVKNQGSCGACWAFSAVSNIEGLYARKYRSLKNFSEQQLVDCDYYNYGCGGGWMDKSMEYIRRAGGLTYSSYYPQKYYKSTCKFRSNMAAVRVQSYRSAGTTNEEYIKQMVYDYGSIAVGFNANYLQYYRGGVLNISSRQCNPKALNHAVNIIGWGVDARGVPYWTVRNSWGSRWGEQGYFKIRRGVSACGINQYVVTAIIA